MADEPVVSTGAARGDLDADEPDADELLDADLLVEEVSIDGMCGVYSDGRGERPARSGPPGSEHLVTTAVSGGTRLIDHFEHGLEAPICLTWELTYACNLSCVHCLSSSGRRDPRELTTAQVKAVIDELQRMQVFYVNIGGGEPTVRPDFWELVAPFEERAHVLRLRDYPNCDFISWDAVATQRCPVCNSYAVIKRSRGTTRIQCAADRSHQVEAAPEQEPVEA